MPTKKEIILSYLLKPLVLNGSTLFFELSFVFTRILFHIPEGIHPYYRTVLGYSLWFFLTMKAFEEADATNKIHSFICYFVTAVNLFFGLISLFLTLKILF